MQKSQAGYESAMERFLRMRNQMNGGNPGFRNRPQYDEWGNVIQPNYRV
jgi:hypothetical protein